MDMLEPVLPAVARRNVLDLGRVQYGNTNLGDKVLVLFPGLDVDCYKQDRVLGVFNHGQVEVKVGELVSRVIRHSAAETEIALDSLDGPTPFLVGLDAFRTISV